MSSSSSASSTNNNNCLARYQSQIRQRDQLQLFQTFVPPVRFTPGNPYQDNPGVTPFQLAMRRKFDVLQYRSSGGGTVTGGQTRAARWSALVRGGSLRRQWVAPPLAADSNYTACDLLPTPVSNSGVPCGGDTDALYLDLAVPQYQYEDPLLDRNYADFADTVVEPFYAYYSPGPVPTTSAGSTTTTNNNTWATVRFTDAILQNRYNLRASVPLAITVSGTDTRYADGNLAKTVTVGRTLVLFFNDTPAKTLALPDVTLTMTFHTAADASFSITQYLGSIENAVLQGVTAEINTIYTVRVQCTVTFGAAFNRSKVSASVAANVSPSMVDTYAGLPGAVTLGPLGSRPFGAGVVALVV